MGTYGRLQSGRGMQVNAKKCQGNVWICVQRARGMQENARGKYGRGYKCQGMLEDVMESLRNARAIQGIAGECKGNAWEWVQRARGMQGNAKGTYGSVQNIREMQGNAWEWAQSGRGIQGNAAGCQENVWEVV